MLFWRDVTWIRHLIAVNINSWALYWCNFLSRSSKVSDLGCRHEPPPRLTNAGGRGSWRNDKMWMAVVSLHPLAYYKWNDHACTSMCWCTLPCFSLFPLLVELHISQRRTARSYLRHVWTSPYILVCLFSDIPLPTNRKSHTCLACKPKLPGCHCHTAADSHSRLAETEEVILL